MRSAKASKGGHHVNAAAVRHARRERLDFGRRLDDPKAVSQPLNHRTSDENASFERVLSRLSDTASDRGQQFVL